MSMCRSNPPPKLPFAECRSSGRISWKADRMHQLSTELRANSFLFLIGKIHLQWKPARYSVLLHCYTRGRGMLLDIQTDSAVPIYEQIVVQVMFGIASRAVD